MQTNIQKEISRKGLSLKGKTPQYNEEMNETLKKKSPIFLHVQSTVGTFVNSTDHLRPSRYKNL